MRRLLFVPCLLGLVVAPGCGSDDASGPSGASANAQAIFVVPSAPDALKGEAWLDHPFPSELRTENGGYAVFTGFPNPREVPLIDAYVKSTKGMLKGFSPASAIYLRFSAPLDAASLPADPPASTAKDAAVQLVDVDPASPERGQRRLAHVSFREEKGVYWSENTLSVLPMLGAPLRPSTQYAVVVTNKAKSKNGGPVSANDALKATMTSDAAFKTAVEELGKAGLAASDIVHMTTFHTNDPVAETFAVFDDVKAQPAPTARDLKKTTEAAAYTVYEGTYGPSPNYQAGTPPFGKPENGGAFVFEGDKPKLQNTFDLRFALSVPESASCPMPQGGFLIVLYAHGTGGDYRSFVDDGTAGSLASQCLATMGIDQIFHGTRPGTPPESDPQREQTIQLLFFNFDNPIAARTSNRQSAADVVQQARLFSDSKMVIPGAVSKTGTDIAFDASKLTFFGHSQGGLNGPLFLAGSPLARGGVLSGAGSAIAIALLEKTKPVDVSAAMRLLVGLSNPDDAKELDVFHPAMTLVQSIIDVADPLHYARSIVREPRPGASPKSIYQTEGIGADGVGDSYAPPHGIEALGVAIGLPRMAPGVRPIQESIWAGLGDVSIPSDGLTGNLANGQASGVIAQFAPAKGKDGHFVVFNNAQARAQAAVFLKNLTVEPKGRVPAPSP